MVAPATPRRPRPPGFAGAARHQGFRPPPRRYTGLQPLLSAPLVALQILTLAGLLALANAAAQTALVPAARCTAAQRRRRRAA